MNYMTDNKTNNSNEAPTYLAFEKNEMKKILLGFHEDNGRIEISLSSHGAHDDINEIALLLSFALEKILDEAENENND